MRVTVTVATVAAWETGVARLHPRRVPAGASPREWAENVRDAVSLMRLWGKDLHDAGWSTLDVFGMEPNQAHRRLDRLGLVSLIMGGMIEAIDSDSASILIGKDRLTYRRGPRTSGAVPIWAVRMGEGAYAPAG